MSEKEKIMCSTRGLLKGGRAACGYVIVGNKSCSLKPGECALQVGSDPKESTPIQVVSDSP
ncbi:hypothetical protein [Quatrionicoccus australiensis]|uniref:hypothetical protein n=1 Tax=Quatrionicoccus australiensis TaxID=138118 RepID=UPI001CF9D066|nr:hypothetical protein [Quatrionicoccus australiensis]MCB4358468.1 hypothetical protein [Quatrionicoccus australiensis]